MRYKIAIMLLLVFAFIGAVSAATFVPSEGSFAFREVENYTLHNINFTVPTEYKLQDKDKDFLHFKDGKNKLKITVKKNAKVKKVKSTKKVKSGKATLGATKGYLVDRNGKSYTFFYKEGKYLVTIKSNELPLIIGVIGEG